MEPSPKKTYLPQYLKNQIQTLGSRHRQQLRKDSLLLSLHQAREDFVNFRFGRWSKEEDEILFQGIRKFGMDWESIRDMLNNRTPHQCLSRWRELCSKDTVPADLCGYDSCASDTESPSISSSQNQFQSPQPSQSLPNNNNTSQFSSSNQNAINPNTTTTSNISLFPESNLNLHDPQFQANSANFNNSLLDLLNSDSFNQSSSLYNGTIANFSTSQSAPVTEVSFNSNVPDQYTTPVSHINQNNAAFKRIKLNPNRSEPPKTLQPIKDLVNVIRPVNQKPVQPPEEDILFSELVCGNFQEEDEEEDLDYKAPSPSLDFPEYNQVVDHLELSNIFGRDESDSAEETDTQKQSIFQNSKGGLFGKECLALLRVQQKQNFQLVFQAYALEVNIKKGSTPMSGHWRQQALKLLDLHYSNLALYKHEGYLSFYCIPGIELLGSMFNYVECPIPDEPSITKFHRKISTVKPRKMKQKYTTSDTIEDLQNGSAYNTTFESTGGQDNFSNMTIQLPRHLDALLSDILSPIFQYALRPRLRWECQRVRMMFSPSEDNLLRIGLIKFGDNFDSIRSHLLPGRTSKQLETRFNNLKNRKSPSNPVKDYYLSQDKPLTVEEIELLRIGISRYGRKFREINENLLPHRPIFVLRKAAKMIPVDKSKSKTKKGSDKEIFTELDEVRRKDLELGKKNLYKSNFYSS